MGERACVTVCECGGCVVRRRIRLKEDGAVSVLGRQGMAGVLYV